MTWRDTCWESCCLEVDQAPGPAMRASDVSKPGQQVERGFHPVPWDNLKALLEATPNSKATTAALDAVLGTRN